MRALQVTGITLVLFCNLCYGADNTAKLASYVIRVSEGGGVNSKGSGTAISPNLIITCGHLFRDSKGPVIVSNPYAGSNRATLIADSLNPDLAVLQVQGNLPYYVKLAEKSVSVNSRVVFAGYGSNGFRAVYSQVRPNRYVQEHITLTSDCRQGDSGGGVLYEGKLVGVIWGTSGGVHAVPLTQIRSWLRNRRCYPNYSNCTGAQCEIPSNTDVRYLHQRTQTKRNVLGGTRTRAEQTVVNTPVPTPPPTPETPQSQDPKCADRVLLALTERERDEIKRHREILGELNTLKENLDSAKVPYSLVEDMANVKTLLGIMSEELDSIDQNVQGIDCGCDCNMGELKEYIAVKLAEYLNAENPEINPRDIPLVIYLTDKSNVCEETDAKVAEKIEKGYNIRVVVLKPQDTGVKDVPKCVYFPSGRTIRGKSNVMVFLTNLVQ